MYCSVELSYNDITATVSFTDLDQGREILSRFSLPKSMKHSVQQTKFLPCVPGILTQAASLLSQSAFVF
jgi:hypothetical protein